MRSILRAAALCAAIAVPAAFAQPYPTSTYPGLSWNFSTAQQGLSGCNLLVLDATGAISRSDQYTVYGYLNCPQLGGTLLADGNAYFDATGRFNMKVALGVNWQLLCTGLGSALTGNCSLYDAGGFRGADAFVGFR